MATYLAFLRAINLGAKRKFAMEELRGCLHTNGYPDAVTHIHTGNVLLTSSRRTTAAVSDDLESIFAADRGFEVPTIVFTPTEFLAVARDVDELAAAHTPARHYVSLVRDHPTPDAVTAVEATSTEHITIVARDRAIHFLVDEAHPQGGVDITKSERLVGVTTNRNATVIKAICAKWL